MLVTATELQPGQTFQVRYEKRWSNKMTIKQIGGRSFNLNFFLVETTTGKTKLIRATDTLRLVA